MTGSYTNTSFRHKHANVEGKSENNVLSAVLKDFQLPSIQFCSIKLGDGVLHVAARRELDHSVLKQKRGLGPGSGGKGSLGGGGSDPQEGRKKDHSPLIFVGPVSVHKGNLSCFSHQVFQVLFQSMTED